MEKRRGAAEHLLGEHRVELYAVELRPRERAGLVPDRVRHCARAEVVHECGAAERVRVLLGEPEDTGRPRCELRTSAAVTAPVGRLEIDEVGGHLQRAVERRTLQCASWLGFEREHGVPGLGRAEPLEPGVAVLEEEVGDLRVVRALPAVAGGPDGLLGERRRPMASMS